jgi:hypothetical protein
VGLRGRFDVANKEAHGSDGDPAPIRREEFTVVKEPNFYKPWELAYQHTSSGFACVSTATASSDPLPPGAPFSIS